MQVPLLVRGILVLSLLSIPVTTLAAREVEPNNSPEQATLVDPSQPIEGSVDDADDYYKIILPESGPVGLRLEQFPAGSQAILGVFGFRDSDSAPLTERRGGKNGRLRLNFTARERIGLVRVGFVFADTVCRDQWCAARLTANGPWYTTRESPLAPTEWQGAKVLPAPTYRLHILQSGLEKEVSPADLDSVPPGYLRFADDSGLSFRYPPTWRRRAASRPGQVRFAPGPGAPAPELRIELELRLRTDYPGSSAERQLNLVERDLNARGADIRKRGVLEIDDLLAPYLVAVLPAGEGQELAEMQVVVPFTDHYCLVSYHALTGHYADGLGIFENLLRTLRLQQPPTAGEAPQPTRQK